jgi:hypothetical protein
VKVVEGRGVGEDVEVGVVGVRVFTATGVEIQEITKMKDKII